MKFTFAPMSAEDVRAISAWHYEEPYSVYDMGHDVDNTDIENELLDRRSPHYAVRDEEGELLGFFGFGSASEVWGNEEPYLYVPNIEEKMIPVGLGMRPDLTGNGLGLAFVNAGLDFARKEFAPDSFRLYVMPFNERAIRVYERAGFVRVGTYMQQYDGGEREFIEMRRRA
jgi:ribosomal-protein-alanine N-acetyltransferase